MSKNTKEIADDSVCHVCGSKTSYIRRKKIRYDKIRDVRECTDCGLVYLWPLNIEQNKVSDFYTNEKFRNMPRAKLGLAEHKSEEIFKARLGQAQRRFEWVKENITQKSSMLEIGCSAGSFCSIASRYVDHFEAIELDPIFAEFTRQRHNVEVFETPIEEFVKTGKKYDVICMWHVLEHLIDPTETITKLKSMLNEDGKLFIEVPNIDDPLLSIFKSEAFDNFYYQEPHLYYFSPKTLEIIFDKVEMNYSIRPFQLYSFWNSLNWLIKKKPQKNQNNIQSKIDIIDISYRYFLEKKEKTDTIFAILNNNYKK